MLRRLLSLVVLSAALASLALPAPASAIVIGVESNSELVNFGVSRTSQAATLERMRQQGVRIVRINMGWNEVAGAACATRDAATLRNPDNGCYDWAVFDGVVQEATARGIQVLVSVSRAPEWLHGTADPAYLGATSAQWARTVMHYEAFMAAAATRYTSGSVHGTVRLWTIWNEPNSSTLR